MTSFDDTISVYNPQGKRTYEIQIESCVEDGFWEAWDFKVYAFKKDTFTLEPDEVDLFTKIDVLLSEGLIRCEPIGITTTPVFRRTLANLHPDVRN